MQQAKGDKDKWDELKPENEREWTAIDMDFNYLHFKCYEESTSRGEGGVPERKLTSYRCATSWKQRIGLFSSTADRIETLDEARTRLAETTKTEDKRKWYKDDQEWDWEDLQEQEKEKDKKKKTKKNDELRRRIRTLLDDDASEFRAGLEAIVSPYVRIFSSFINAGREFILAHNQFVSIFNLTRERWTERHHEFGDAVR